MVISQGYVTSSSGLRTLGVKEYSPTTRGCLVQKETLCKESFWVPYIDFFGGPRYQPAINKCREARELRMATLHLETSQPLKNIPTG